MLNRQDSIFAIGCQPSWALLAISAFPLLLMTSAGCSQVALRMQSPESLEDAVAEVDLVQSMTVPFGVHPLPVNSVGLVTNLAGTGSNPPLGPGRATMLEEIKRHEVKGSDAILSSPNTSLVKVKAFIPPGAQKGDRIDIEVLVPRDSQTTSLSGGALLQAELREYVRLGGRYREGPVSAVAEGQLLVDPLPDADKNPESQLRGRILGGAVVAKSRALGLTLRPAAQGVQNSRRIGDAINRRFYIKSHGRTVGVATPKTDEYIELTIHPRYKHNIRRYLEVVRGVAVNETEKQRQARIRLLGRQLLDSITSSAAALRLEALAEGGRETLKTGITSSNAEVRFYSAEALAYLDDPDAAAILARAARDEPAFRAAALNAMSIMDSPEAYDALITLLESPSAEARYGAFHALWKMNPRHPQIRGENLNNRLSLHLVRSEGAEMVHVTRSRRPEIAVFGSDVRFATPMILEAGRNLMINGDADGRVRLTRFSPTGDDQQLETSSRVDDVIRAIVQLGGGYPDVVDALYQAKESRSLDCRFKVDAMPREGRPYQRKTHLANATEEAASTTPEGDKRRRLLPLAWPGTDTQE